MTQVKSEKEKHMGKIQENQDIMFQVSPASGSALSFPSKNVTTHVKCCQSATLIHALMSRDFTGGFFYRHTSPRCLLSGAQTSFPTSRGKTSIYQISHCQNQLIWLKCSAWPKSQAYRHNLIIRHNIPQAQRLSPSIWPRVSPENRLFSGMEGMEQCRNGLLLIGCMEYVGLLS